MKNIDRVYRAPLGTFDGASRDELGEIVQSLVLDSAPTEHAQRVELHGYCERCVVVLSLPRESLATMQHVACRFCSFVGRNAAVADLWRHGRAFLVRTRHKLTTPRAVLWNFAAVATILFAADEDGLLVRRENPPHNDAA